MRYLVKASLKKGKSKLLKKAIEDRTLGKGSVAGGEYLKDMKQARLLDDGTISWVEVCYCPTPLQEEIPYWEEFFELLKIKNAHSRDRCKDLNGTEPWSCSSCNCTELLEERMRKWGTSFIEKLANNNH